MPRSRSEFARAFSDIIQANYYPDEIQAMAESARNTRVTLDDIAEAHKERFVEEQTDGEGFTKPYDWGNTSWED